ncbi:MAG: CxxC-x17-CxxC domain-containing protein [bacterium]
MKKYFTHNVPSVPLGSDSDVMKQVGEIKRKLDILEKKIDSLLSQSTLQQSRKSHFQFSHQEKGNRDYGSTGINLTKATCSACHKACKIPFKPTGNRPVYCSDCFSKRKKDDSFQSNRFDKSKKGGFDRYFSKRKDTKRD